MRKLSILIYQLKFRSIKLMNLWLVCLKKQRKKEKKEEEETKNFQGLYQLILLNTGAIPTHPRSLSPPLSTLQRSNGSVVPSASRVFRRGSARSCSRPRSKPRFIFFFMSSVASKGPFLDTSVGGAVFLHVCLGPFLPLFGSIIWLPQKYSVSVQSASKFHDSVTHLVASQLYAFFFLHFQKWAIIYIYIYIRAVLDVCSAPRTGSTESINQSAH